MLTCTRCNNEHGSDLDRHIGAGDLVRDIAAGRRPVRGKVTLAEYTLVADITLGDERTIAVSPDNNPRALEATKQFTPDTFPQEVGMRFWVPHDLWREEVAWLRAGYLCVFAALGYRYTMLEVLRPVREQFLRPSERLTPGLVRRVSPPIDRRIYFVNEPPELHSVMLSFGDRLVFLPGLRNDESFYARMCRPPVKGTPPVQVTAPLSAPLPKVPVFVFDFSPRALYEVLHRVYPETAETPASV